MWVGARSRALTTIRTEYLMKTASKIQPPKPGPVRPSPAVEGKQKSEKAEPLEVAGRHSNVGQKDHKGAR